MGKAAKWLRLFLTGKKEKEKHGLDPVMQSGPLSTPPVKEKKRWSFRRSSTGTALEQKSASVRGHARRLSDSDVDQKRQAAAIKIQSVFRAHLARKALCALKGLVKLQALIRGHLVRMQATATLRRIRAMVTAQARVRTQRLRMLEEAHAMSHHRQNNHWRSPQESRSRQSYEMEENIRIVEMDIGEPRSSAKSRNIHRKDQRLPTSYSATNTPYKRDPSREPSPSRSILTDHKSPQADSGHFAEYFITSEISSPPYLSTPSIQDCPLFPSYMANTESSRAKARSHSAPKQRRPSIEGRSSSRGGRMQRNSCYVKLDRSSISLQESECGSTSTVMTSTQYARSLMAYELFSELNYP
ncbi:uncharacterized protein A4U43_C03F5390 [Asparagus officinalis]|uniref:DUF4005 domain-containing protein n=1 Tax=Asparagus officinalis TaxID=4686 RepID=A0A5P1F7K5_ASPOF|nr:protein IQ-DOMAIN 14-like [Asparagus officinalis]XP_020256121.1 protein IQ-DOMAIN 14-like [Asparagus officinalis]ONK74356.1 uncharacterized protein A4U43_C03F5390 [Asparagus officinalis]